MEQHVAVNLGLSHSRRTTGCTEGGSRRSDCEHVQQLTREPWSEAGVDALDPGSPVTSAVMAAGRAGPGG